MDRPNGALPEDASKTSLADLPYEMQVAILEAAAGPPQIVFIEIDEANHKRISRPVHAGLAYACRLSRYLYTQNRASSNTEPLGYWLDQDRDIFYMQRDIAFARFCLPSSSVAANRDQLPEGLSMFFGCLCHAAKFMHNIAVDLQFLGSHPRREAMLRLLFQFPLMKELHVLVPRDKDVFPKLAANAAERLQLGRLHDLRVVHPPNCDKEIWCAVRWHLKKACGFIKDRGRGWPVPEDSDPTPLVPEILGRLASNTLGMPERGPGLCVIV
ncbi:hypothetical protein QBC46DRAFT_259469 [Diplogelasinospora grovesii]|uniref:Uncharacterized protein n=1 Tax=Diplogelasinospora grovesii TaxID=303347 RepID=A0AAN6N8E9_9PEZI|nr:hypothetical protein QBC46DRAFT_259469 [Diplogelasinospora grovesii]